VISDSGESVPAWFLRVRYLDSTSHFANFPVVSTSRIE
jgi:hypothetical protein